MATLIPFLEQIEATIAACLAAAKQRTAQVENLLDGLSAAGIEYEFARTPCAVTCYGRLLADVRIVIRLKPASPASAVETICRHFGGDWFQCRDGHSAITQIEDINLHIDGVIFDEQKERAA